MVEKLSMNEGLRRCLWTSLESSKSRFLCLPSKNIWQSTRLLIVGLDQGEGVQDLLPLRQVVHILERCMVGVVEEVEDDHDRVVGKGGGGACKPTSASLLQQPLQRLKPLGQELAEVLFHQRFSLLLTCGKHHLGQFCPHVLVVASHHVRLHKLKISPASKTGPSCNEPGDRHRLCQLHSIPGEHGQLAERGLLLVLAGPGGDRQPVVLEVEVACVQQKTSQLPLCLDVKVGELDHRHFGAGLSFEFEYERELCEGVSP